MSKPRNVYIVANYSMKPRDTSQTFRPGYIKDGNNMRWDESVDVRIGLRNRDLTSSQIIINITEQKVVKNNLNNNKSFMELFSYFYSSSPTEISKALKATGISVTETKETADEPIQEDVSIQAEESSRSEPASSTDAIGTGETVKKRRRKKSDSTDTNAATAAGDRESQAQAEPSNVSH